MGLEFIDRSLRTTGVVLLIFLPFGVYYLGVFPALALFTGGVWGMLNLIFISALVRATIHPGRINKRKVWGMALFKFPFLYCSGYCLLRVSQFEPLVLMIGFSSLLAIIVLRAVSRALTQVHDEPDRNSEMQELA